MRKSTVAILGLSVAFIASNAFWLYEIVDAGVTQTYTKDSLARCRGTAKQALAVLPVAAQPGATRQSVIDAARMSGSNVGDLFEKDDFLWIGDIGLRFNDAGRLVEARPSVDPF